MANIYALHDKAFQNVSAYVVLDSQGKLVAKVALKYPRDGAGRLYAYFHLIGVEMQRSFAGGYGYDKASAAVTGAVLKAKKSDDFERPINRYRDDLQKAVREMGGERWADAFEKAGYTVLQAV